MLGVKPLDYPMDPNLKFTANEGDVLDDPEKYRRLVGKLKYLTVTRPDISFPVSVVSQFLSASRTSHWDVIIRILRYLKKSPGHGLVYGDHGHNKIDGFSDADWAKSPLDLRLTTGYCVFVGGNLVFWKSNKQSVVARSSAES
ncbi:uncharacterized mitochondrial protein AtMg00810-like [Telopea speciosissima]|uniref:uncharacterized mitochondrial protein AtMg00810-like n=1 Tax=Telopea speciosissima TaxID=54955 RepID=UPI001CC62C12|nr:uncharacterized mitochondrial protein AtMg00810-like [Telopea speciosissima]